MKPFLSDPILLILIWTCLVFAGLIIFVDMRLHDDSEVFQVMAGLATGFGGAALGRVKTDSSNEPSDKAKTTTQITKTVVDPGPEVKPEQPK